MQEAPRPSKQRSRNYLERLFGLRLAVMVGGNIDVAGVAALLLWKKSEMPERILQCPSCGGEHTHHDQVTVYARAEDAELPDNRKRSQHRSCPTRRRG